MRVWVGDQLTVDAWNGAGTDELTADVALVADQATSVKVEYRDISGDAKLWFGWTSPELPKEVVGPEWTPLSQSQKAAIDDADPRGVLFEQLTAVDGDFLDTGDVNFADVTSGAIDSSVIASSDSTTHPAQRTRGYIVLETSGTYQF